MIVHLCGALCNKIVSIMGHAEPSRNAGGLESSRVLGSTWRRARVGALLGRHGRPWPQGTTGKHWRCGGRAALVGSDLVRQTDVVGRTAVIKHAKWSVSCKQGECFEIPSSCSYSLLHPSCFPSFLPLLLERSGGWIGGSSWGGSVSSQRAEIQHLNGVSAFCSAGLESFSSLGYAQRFTVVILFPFLPYGQTWGLPYTKLFVFIVILL